MRPAHCIEGSRRLFGRRASNPQAATLLAIAALFSSVGLLMLLSRAPAHAQTDTDAAQSSLSIAIFVNSRNDRCFDSGEVAAINHLAKAEQDRINASGGILRRRLELQILDDKRAPDRAIANVKGALANCPATVPTRLSMRSVPTLAPAVLPSCRTSASTASSKSRGTYSRCVPRKMTSVSR